MSVPNQSKVTEPAQRKKTSVLIIQMGGVEEIFRSLIALKAVKHLYPSVSIQMICRKESAGPARRVEWLDGVIETPRFVAGEDPVIGVAQWIEKVIHQNYDILANWTFSEKYLRMSAIATSLIPAMVKIGEYFREDSSIGSYDAWSMYRQAWVRDLEIEQDIHHTDIITTELLTVLQIHAGDPTADAGSSVVTSKYFFKSVPTELPQVWLRRPKGLKWVALHMDSLGNRASEWIEMVLRRNPDFGIVVIGDAAASEQFNSERVLMLGSTLNFDSLTAILTHCSWLVSGKHPIVDLASLMNVRVLYVPGISSKEFSLKWTEEGPYGNGHMVMVSQDELKPELLYGVWSYYQSEWFHKNSLTLEGHFQNLGMSETLPGIQIYKSRIRPANEGGGVCYEMAAGKSFDFEAWIYRVRGQIARAWFCGWLPSIDQEVAKLNLSPDLIKRIRGINESIQVIEKLSLEGKSTAIELLQVSQKTKTGYLMSVEDRESIEVLAKKLLEVEGLIDRVIQVEPELRCLLRWYQQLIHNLAGATLAEMAKETAQAFDLVLEGVDILSAYTRKTLEVARPKAIGATVQPIKAQDLNS
jgi:hypothetical protein